MTFHPGKVLKVLRPDDEDVESCDEVVQANVQMWDGNVFTFIVEEDISDKIDESAIVLVDYTPRSDTKVPIATQKIVKVLKGDTGEEVWQNYQDFQNTRKKNTQTSPFQPSYMG